MNIELSRICDLFATAQYRIIVISAYIGSETLDTLLSAGPAGVSRVVFANWTIENIASGASEWKAWDVSARHGVPLFSCPRLHAKVYIADDIALVGSANATWNGLQGGDQGNLEVLVEVGTDVREISNLLETVQSNSGLAPPFGNDVLISDHGYQLMDSNVKLMVWTPQSEPDHFIRAMRGEVSHNDESRIDSRALGLIASESSPGVILATLRSQTVFRFVHNEFENRLKPMDLDELRQMLAHTVSAQFDGMSDDDVFLLMRWLSRFGQNAHLGPRGVGYRPSLVPGRFVGTEHTLRN